MYLWRCLAPTQSSAGTELVLCDIASGIQKSLQAHPSTQRAVIQASLYKITIMGCCKKWPNGESRENFKKKCYTQTCQNKHAKADTSLSAQAGSQGISAGYNSVYSLPSLPELLQMRLYAAWLLLPNLIACSSVWLSVWGSALPLCNIRRSVQVFI